MNIDITFLRALIFVIAVLVYLALDGFDLGIGSLFNTFKLGSQRDTAMSSTAPVWDGNELWLVMCGSGLLAAFRGPMA